jgi:hypothetical protein
LLAEKALNLRAIRFVKISISNFFLQNHSFKPVIVEGSKALNGSINIPNFVKGFLSLIEPFS